MTVKFGKQLSFKLPNAKRFARQDTLGDDYSIEAVFERMSGKRIFAPKKKKIIGAIYVQDVILLRVSVEHNF